MKFLDTCLESRSTSGNATFDIADVFYADHAGNMHDMMQESMLEGSTPEVLWTPENSQNDKESETPRRSFKRKREIPENDVDREYLEEFKKIKSSRVDDMDPDRMFLLSMVPYLKELSPSENLDFKFKMLEMLKTKVDSNK
ncbi:hypothetical protein TNCV_3562311 [Trichonephila clavipes]|nr:hypothetical protein TNCV_3562311 [Trichonephila clavipes]